jgi:hypothetical protein
MEFLTEALESVGRDSCDAVRWFVKQKHPNGQMACHAEFYSNIQPLTHEYCPFPCDKDSTMMEVLLQNEIIAGSETAAVFRAADDVSPALEFWGWTLGSLRDANWGKVQTMTAVADQFEEGPLRDLVLKVLSCAWYKYKLAEMQERFSKDNTLCWSKDAEQIKRLIEGDKAKLIVKLLRYGMKLLAQDDMRPGVISQVVYTLAVIESIWTGADPRLVPVPPEAGYEPPPVRPADEQASRKRARSDSDDDSDGDFDE